MGATSEACPKCGNRELDESGGCPVCRDALRPSPAQEPAPPPKSGGTHFSGLIQMDISSSGDERPGETPEWKLELSKRLSEIRRKRGLDPADAPTLPFAGMESEDPGKPAEAATQAAMPEESFPKPAGRRSRPVPKIQERGGTAQPRPARKSETSLPLFRANKSGATHPAANSADSGRKGATIKDPDPEQVQKLIDSIMMRQEGERTPSISAAPPSMRVTDHSAPHEEKLVLLSRTLSGLIDLLIIGLCTGAFIIAADLFSGIVIVDSVSKAYYALLLLATYLVYSIFFLGIANQTVGMMIKDLRVIGPDGRRPRLASITGRCLAYLLSWLSCGAGFAWGIFDRHSRCLHDHLSGTRVIRI